MACTIDFRRLDEGFGGKTYKRKREEAAAAVAGDDKGMEAEMETPAGKRSAVESAENPEKAAVSAWVYGKRRYEGVIAGKVSGRKWKVAQKQRASAIHVSRSKKTHEEREREKAVKKAYGERMNELKEEIRRNKVEKRKAREEREKRKKDNIMRSGTKFQKITNPTTLNKISKSKHRNLLKVVPDDFLNTNNNKKKKNNNIII